MCRPWNARSWLFAPGDSERKMGKAAAGAADIVILDLEDAVATREKPEARALVAEFLDSCPEPERGRLWVRVNPLDGPDTLADLATVLPSRPGGIMLPKSSGRQDVTVLDHYLSALEVAHGIERGSTEVIALIAETADSMFTAGTYRGAPRLAAMTWGAEDLAGALGAVSAGDSDGHYGFTFELARSLCLMGAVAAGVAAVDTVHPDFRDLDGLRDRAEAVRRIGYRGSLAIHPAQVDVINEVFTPTAEEIAAAQEIVDLFAAHPGAGAIGHHGVMLDRPHLSRAQALLAAANRAFSG
ncbi:HpcH/HpaI aldolase/citrate lyase family protein [Nocardia gamkensis]|uniref:CoA ester lyase n=1 Tax=Nocardia gamkensis TaxID=352869 RepID=A0A7X6L187_9NOCA|nr:CoA ester lyase [Nocardia gamkensis]NKY25848.1 CoA ester lyase [Nocardia gamkensis]NQE68965.1 (3S)-malyl-CoA thioesterase [Nocardia gamkensis]